MRPFTALDGMMSKLTIFHSPAQWRAMPADQLRGMLGLTSVSYVEVDHHLALVDSTLAGA